MSLFDTDAGRKDVPRASLDLGARWRRWRNRLAASRSFQAWASRFILTRKQARKEGEALFDILAGFVHAQTLHALVELRVLHALHAAPLDLPALAAQVQVSVERLQVLVRAGVALGLLEVDRRGEHHLSARGAAVLGVPGLEAMILHHRAFYRDLEDPAAFFRGEGGGELARFWPYVFEKAPTLDPEVAARYSDLMAQSQVLVAEETLRAVSLRDVRHLVDIGGGTGAFLVAALESAQMKATLFDLPQVVAGAQARFDAHGLSPRVTIHPGSFQTDQLPQGADMISLVRVLYDHSDVTVSALLKSVFAALPPGGRVLISEPMSGGDQPTRPGDTYFALYTMAMETGKTRAVEEISAHLCAAGFDNIQHRQTYRPFVTSVLTAEVPKS